MRMCAPYMYKIGALSHALHNENHKCPPERGGTARRKIDVRGVFCVTTSGLQK